MTPTAPREPEQAIFEANLAALAEHGPRSAEALQAAGPPANVRPVVGRDGTPTYAWMDDAGVMRWLGRVTMPRVRAPALIDAFQDGGRNVLLRGFGQGAEIELLLRRLASYQAVFVVDETAWTVALALRLHDFSRDLRRGRLLIFTETRAWEAFQEFLIEHDGFLTPERVLAWSWFDAEAIAEVSDRLAAVGSAVSRERAGRIAELRRERAAATPAAGVEPAPPSIAVISNVSDTRVLRAAACLRTGADYLGIGCQVFVLDGPSMVHPHAVEAAVWRYRPAIIVLLDVGPGALSFELPPAGLCVLRTQAQPAPADWLRQLPPSARLAVTSSGLRDQVVAAGFEAARVLLFSSAAAPGLDNAGGSADSPLLVLADGHDVSAESVGLHLASHQRLWDEAAEIIRRKCDTYHDEQAGAVLESAERRLGIRIDSGSVREGIASRIRLILGPVLVRRAYCLALIEAGVDFHLYGGWSHDPILARHDRGAWPEPREAAAALAGHAVVVSLGTSGRLSAALLDALAAGLIGLLRAHPADDAEDGLASILDPSAHVRRFDSREALIELVRAVKQQPETFRTMAAEARTHVNRQHTWAIRVSAVIAASQAS